MCELFFRDAHFGIWPHKPCCMNKTYSVGRGTHNAGVLECDILLQEMSIAKRSAVIVVEY